MTGQVAGTAGYRYSGYKRYKGYKVTSVENERRRAIVTFVTM